MYGPSNREVYVNSFLLNGSLVFLVLFAILSFVDGVYLHLIKYRLQEKKDSKNEHLAHTGRAILFIPITLMLFYWNLSGLFLWFLAALVAIDLGVEAFDVLEEKKSRAKIGGLSSGEYLLHVVLTTTRVVALTLSLASKPVEAWISSADLPVYPEAVRFVSFQIVPGAAFIALVHVILVFRSMLITELISKFQKWRVL